MINRFSFIFLFLTSSNQCFSSDGEERGRERKKDEMKAKERK
jgi:hypothetical protein